MEELHRIRHCAPQPQQTPRRQHAAAKPQSLIATRGTALGSLVPKHLLQFGAATLMQFMVYETRGVETSFPGGESLHREHSAALPSE